MQTIFISYRRDDTAGEARALYKDLQTSLGEDSVFMDVDSIALGQDFREALQRILETCDIVLALIGREWAGTDRLNDPDDFVRQEIAAALDRDIPITPVLLQGAKMPTEEQLPEDLKRLAYRNGFELRHRRWDSDVQEMITRLGFVSRTEKPLDREPPWAKRLAWGGAGLALIVAVAVWFVSFNPRSDSLVKEWDPANWDPKTTSAYLVADSAHKTKAQAQMRVAVLNHTYANSGFIWIPDFESLSGRELFEVYVGPFENKVEAKQAICEYNRTFNKPNKEHYAFLASTQSTNQDRIYCQDL